MSHRGEVNPQTYRLPAELEKAVRAGLARLGRVVKEALMGEGRGGGAISIYILRGASWGMNVLTVMMRKELSLCSLE